ncbi:MAG: DegQ family serine endoprotease [candidate division Zixibacteria bacterium]|nr:DegQ family serine endoprotease [candidate division Zixibacteria bacterium]
MPNPKFALRSKDILLYSLFASLFILIGILIASNLNFSSHSKAIENPQTQSASKLVQSYGSKFGLFEKESPFTAVAEEVSPAVVNISAEKVLEERYHSFFDDELFRRFFGDIPRQKTPSPRKYKNYSLGSGFIFDKKGYILTNNHVVSGADNITVKLADGSEYKAKLMGTDSETDIAVIKIETRKPLPTVELGDSDAMRVGDWVIAIGNPFPQLGLDRTVTVGVVSAKGRKGLRFGEGESPAFQNYIQTDAAINPGNSGGPLCDIEGKVIGINAAITNPYSFNGMSFNIGIGFAIPINLAKSVVPRLMAGKEVSRGYLGIAPSNITKDLKDALDLPTTEGVLVQQVQPNTPAAKAGMKTGDVIVTLNGKKVTDADQFRLQVAEIEPGKTIDLGVLRSGKKMELKVKLGERSKLLTATPQEKPQKQQQEEKDWLGIQVETATEDLASQFGVAYTKGVIVTGVDQGSIADDSGIQPGDIISEIDRKQILNKEDYTRIIKGLKDRKKAIAFLISRKGTTFYLVVKPE